MSGKGEDAWRARAKRPFLLSPSDFSLFRPRERGPRPRHHPPAESLSPCLLHLHTMRRRDIPVVGGRECSPPQRIIRMSFNMAAHRNYGTERAGERANRRERNARPPIFLPLSLSCGKDARRKVGGGRGKRVRWSRAVLPFQKRQQLRFMKLNPEEEAREDGFSRNDILSTGSLIFLSSRSVSSCAWKKKIGQLFIFRDAL